jgi:hypothetical protein
MPVFLSMTRIVGQPANAPAPTTFVDVRDDGIPELTESSPVAVPSSMALTIGPVATPIRLRVAASHAGVGNSEVSVKLVVTPSVGITTNTWTAGCGAYYDVKPTFQDELQIVGVTNSNEVTVAVLGLGFKPVFLGVPYQIPCFAFPSPDLLLLCPPSGALTLPVPAAIRPLQLWTQGVSVSQSLLASSDVFRVNAL